MRSILRTRSEVERVGRDAPGFFLYGLDEAEANFKQWKRLDEVAEIIRRSFTANRFPESEFYHIGVPDIDAERGEVTNIDRIPGKLIKGGKTVFRGGDIIFARIEPSIYNKKTAIVPNVGDCLGSTELLAARPREGTNVDYLLWALRSKWVAQQILGKMTGSTGRRRFEDTDFAQLVIPWVESDVQKQIAWILQSARAKYFRLMQEAALSLQQGEQVTTEIIESGNLDASLLIGYQFETALPEDKWVDMEKLPVPNSKRGNQQADMVLDLWKTRVDLTL